MNTILNNFYKLDLKDAKIEKVGGQKALLVELEVSASGKVTNGRIYPPKGHQAGLDSWTKPYAKPVLVYHDDNKDPIGRWVNARWVDTEDQALAFLKGDYKALAAIKRAFAAGTPQDIYQAMKKHGALDKGWPGLGKVIGTVRITDAAAIEKFVDGRYLTCSAGQSTDSYTCMLDGHDWHKGQICEHSNGGMDDEGNPVIFLCGNMHGSEVSMVNIPANDTSVTISMKFEDSAGGNVETTMTFSDALEDAPTIVPTVTWEKDMDLNDLKDLSVEALLQLFKQGDALQKFVDALKGDTHYETTWLIRIHDALHHEWDYQVKYQDPKDARMPMAVYQLHGALHDLSMEKDFRDSFLNGPLDEYSSAGEATGEYKIELPGMDDTKKEIALSDTQLSALAAQVKALFEQAQAAATPVTPETSTEQIAGATNGNGEEKEKEDNQEEVVVLESTQQTQSEDDKDDFVEDESIDWEIFDLALETEVGDAKLSSEKRKSLPGKSFCGPGRSFPVPDCAHVTAARRLIGRAKLSADQKSKVLACVNRKAKNMGCDSGTDSTDHKHNCACEDIEKLQTKLNDLKTDYANALVETQTLKDRLTRALKLLKSEIEPNENIDGLKLDTLNTWLDTLVHDHVEADVTNVETPAKATENPSVARTDPTRETSKLGQFARQAVDNYSKILKDKARGKKHADEYLKNIREYLPKDFDIEQYVG